MDDDAAVREARAQPIKYVNFEKFLARLHGIVGETQTKAFRGRLQHLRRLGVPHGPKPGRGSKIDYTEAQFYECAFALELIQCGADPLAVSEFLGTSFEDEILPRMASAYQDHSRLSGADDLFFFATPNLMSAAWKNVAAFKFKWARQRELNGLIFDRGGRRLLLINVTRLVNQIGGALVEWTHPNQPRSKK